MAAPFPFPASFAYSHSFATPFFPARAGKSNVTFESLCQLWGTAAVLVSTVSAMRLLNTDSVVSLSSGLNETLRGGQRPSMGGSPSINATSPRSAAVGKQPSSFNRKELVRFLPFTARDAQVESAASLLTVGAESSMDLQDHTLRPGAGFGFTDNNILLLSPRTLQSESPERNAFSRSIGSDPTVRLVVTYYMYEAKCHFEYLLSVVGCPSVGHSKNEATGIRPLLLSLKDCCKQLMPLLPIGRLSDYLIPCESTSTQLEEAASVASHLLFLVEDLYLACACHPAPNIERGSGVTLDRINKLNSIFAEPSEEDKGHIHFMDACLTNLSLITCPTAFKLVDEALWAILHITPLRSVLRNHFLDSLVTLTEDEERDLLFSIAAQLISPIRPMTRPILGMGSLPPLMDLVTSPFVVVSGLGTGHPQTDTSNAAADILLKDHVGGALSGFRFFAPDVRALTGGTGAQSYEVAHWYQQMASLKTTLGKNKDSTTVIAELQRNFSLREFELGEEEMVQVLQCGITVRTGVPIVILDVPSGVVYGAFAYCWQFARSSNAKDHIPTTKAAFLLRFTLYVCGPPLDNEGGFVSSSAETHGPIGYLQTLLIPETSETVERALSAKTKSSRNKDSRTDSYWQEPRLTNQPLMDTDTNNLTLQSMQVTSLDSAHLIDGEPSVESFSLHRLKRHLGRRLGVEPVDADNLPKSFIVNDNLLSTVLREVVQYQLENSVSLRKVFIHRCGMHLVIDIIPERSMRGGEVDYSPSQIYQYYKEIEDEMINMYRQPLSEELLLMEGPCVTSCDWIDTVIAACRMEPSIGPRTMEDAKNAYFGSDQNTKNDSLFLKSSKSWTSQQLLAVAKEQPQVPPEVWAAQDMEAKGHCIVSPAQYLLPAICKILISIKAAVVVSSSGAASIAFPYITEDRVELLKGMDKVNQAFSAAEDFGIAQLNLMADEAALEYTFRKKTSNGMTKDTRLLSFVDANGLTLFTPSVLPTEDVNDGSSKTDSPLSNPNPHQRVQVVEPPNTESGNSMSRVAQKPRFRASMRKRVIENPAETKHIVNLFNGNEEATNRNLAEPAELLDEKLLVTNPFDSGVGSISGELREEVSHLDFENFGEATAIVDDHTTRSLLFHTSICDEELGLLASHGHCLSTVKSMPQMDGFLRCGGKLYDMILIECTLATLHETSDSLLPIIREQSPTIPVFFCVLGAASPAVAPSAVGTAELPSASSTSLVHSKPDQLKADIPIADANASFIYGETLSKAAQTFSKPMARFIRRWRILRYLRGDESLKYQIKRHIAGGTFGDVFEVSMYASKGRLAMKRITLMNITVESVESLFKEAVLLRSLDHRNIVQLSHITCDDSYLQIFMELCDFTLLDVLTSGEKKSKPNEETDSIEKEKKNTAQSKEPTPDTSIVHSNWISVSKSHATFPHPKQNSQSKDHVKLLSALPNTMRIIRDVLRAVNYLHDHGVVHRDLKPQNILFLNGVAKLADFGSATTVSMKQEFLKSMKGTVPYMAPEVFQGESYSKPCDIWSLGILIGEILGLRFAHTTLLHYPALRDFFSSLEVEESMPIVITNYVGASTAPPSCGEVVDKVKCALQEARAAAKAERTEVRFLKESSNLRLEGSRMVFVIEVDLRKQECKTIEEALPASLVDLLESTFQRNPNKRVTAEQLLEHPIANEKEWMKRMLDAVAVLKQKIQPVPNSADSVADDNFSIQSGSPQEDARSGDDVLDESSFLNPVPTPPENDRESPFVSPQGTSAPGNNASVDISGLNILPYSSENGGKTPIAAAGTSHPDNKGSADSLFLNTDSSHVSPGGESPVAGAGSSQPVDRASADTLLLSNDSHPRADGEYRLPTGPSFQQQYHSSLGFGFLNLKSPSLDKGSVAETPAVTTNTSCEGGQVSADSLALNTNSTHLRTEEVSPEPNCVGSAPQESATRDSFSISFKSSCHDNNNDDGESSISLGF